MSHVAPLLEPLALGAIKLPNPIVMAPMTRSRALDRAVPHAGAPLYYAQRASAGLIISEGTCVSPGGVGSPLVPGIWSEEQIDAWRAVTEAVHAQHGRIVAQLWHCGRAADPAARLTTDPPVAPSAVKIDLSTYVARTRIPFVVPHELRADEIAEIVAQFAAAARNARAAGFDGVELHGANGYLIDQFLHRSSNRREDGYGGSPEHRVRFLLEVTAAVCAAWDPDRVGVRLSPSSTFQDMHDPEAAAVFGAALRGLEQFGLAYVHIVEPGISGALSTERAGTQLDSAWARTRWGGKLIATGGYDRTGAIRALTTGRADAVGFGRLFLANPDLPRRLAQRAPLNEPERATFYQGGDLGYLDYPSLEAEQRLEALRRDVTADLSEILPLGADTAIEDWPTAWAAQRLRDGDLAGEALSSAG